MSRKTILVLIAILILALGGWLYFSSSNTTSTNPDGTKKGLLSSLFPFGNNITNNPTGDQNQTNQDNNATDQTEPSAPRHLTQISSKLIAGFTTIPTDTTPIIEHNVNAPADTQIIQTVYPAVRFVERGTGYIYNSDIKGQNEKKVSGTVIARTAQALFADSGKTAILRYVKADNTTVSTFLGHIVPSSNTLNPGTLEGGFLPDNISDIIVSSDQKNIAYIIPTPGGVAGITSKTDGSTKKQFFSSAFGEWLLDWSTKNIVITSKASTSIEGYTYSVNTAGVLEKIIGGIKGLTTKISPDGETLLYSISGGGGLSLHIYNIKEGSDINTGLQTLPEKCVWGIEQNTFYCAAGTSIPDGSYPDSWYKGITHFNDVFWKITTDTGATNQINDGEGNYLDATNLMFDQTGQYLVFVNKNDTSLWSLDLEKPQIKPSTTPPAKTPLPKFVP